MSARGNPTRWLWSITTCFVVIMASWAVWLSNPLSSLWQDDQAGVSVPDVEIPDSNQHGGNSSDTSTVVPFVVVVQNRSAAPIRIVGIQEGCVRGFCTRFDLDGPIEIAPGCDAEIRGEFRGPDGPFQDELELRYDDGSLRAKAFCVKRMGAKP
jgi:hypothetical protein